MLAFELIQIMIPFPAGYLTEQFPQERLPAHADAAMNLPERNDDAGQAQCFTPGGHVLVVAVDQGAIEIKQNGRQIGGSGLGASRGFASSSPPHRMFAFVCMGPRLGARARSKVAHLGVARSRLPTTSGQTSSQHGSCDCRGDHGKPAHSESGHEGKTLVHLYLHGNIRHKGVQRMRIAQVAPLHESVPPRYYGGTERVVSSLTEKLVALGHDVTLFASGDSVTNARLVKACKKALRLDPDCIDPLAHHVLMIEEVFSRAEDFDIIHFHTDYLHFPFSRRDKVTCLTTLHGRLDIPDLVPLY